MSLRPKALGDGERLAFGSLCPPFVPELLLFGPPLGAPLDAFLEAHFAYRSIAAFSSGLTASKSLISSGVKSSSIGALRAEHGGGELVAGGSEPRHKRVVGEREIAKLGALAPPRRQLRLKRLEARHQRGLRRGDGANVAGE